MDPTEAAVPEDLDLAQFDDEFAEAPIEETEPEEVPDGKYQVKVEAVDLTRAKQSNNPILKWKLRIIGPTHAGRFLWRNSVIKSAANLKWLKTDLHTCGLDLAKLSDLKDSLHRLLDVTLEVTKRSREDNTNVYFNRRIVLANDIPATHDADTPF